jgi:predicted secreted Zn-dependent protease
LRRAGSGHGPYSASTKWDLQISLRYADEPAGCRIASATVELAALITMPILEDASALDGDEIARWEGFIARLKAHELEHIANQTAGAHRLQTALIALPHFATCDAVGEAANTLVLAAEQSVIEDDGRLDAETKHGALTGATFP